MTEELGKALFHDGVLQFCSRFVPKNQLARQPGWGPKDQGIEGRQTTPSEDDQKSGKEKP